VIARRRVLLRAGLAGLVLLVVSVAVGAAIAGLGGPAAFAQTLSRLRPGWLAAAVVAMLAGLSMAGPRFLALLPRQVEERPSPAAAATLMVASTVLNLSFPGPAGELAIATALRRRYGIPVPLALGASLQGRFSGLGASGLLVLLVLPVVEVPPELVPMLWALAGLLGLAGAAAGAVALRPQWLARAGRALPAALAARIGGRAGALLERLAVGIDTVAAQLAEGVRVGPGGLLRALGWSLASHLCFAVAVLCAAAATGATVAPLPALLAHAASVVASIALVILPGGLGAWDATFAGVLVMAGGLELEAAGLVVVAVRITQSLGLFASGAAFVGWSGLLLQPSTHAGARAAE
jgi:uncharacterized membrane protein YbhN (UPF0104 family)